MLCRPANALSQSARLFQVLSCEGEQGNVTGLFDRRSDGALVSCARACLAARTDLAVLGDVLSEQVRLFVVNRERLIRAELTKFGLGKEAALSAALCSFRCSSIYSHLLLQLI